MKRYTIGLIFICISSLSFPQSIESNARQIAKKEYPNDYSMQEYIYNNQVKAGRYMTSVRDIECKKIALKEYPFDYSMQKYIYKNQLEAKQSFE